MPPSIRKTFFERLFSGDPFKNKEFNSDPIILFVFPVERSTSGVNITLTPLPRETVLLLHKEPLRSLFPVPEPIFIDAKGAHTIPDHFEFTPAEPLAIVNASIFVAEVLPFP